MVQKQAEIILKDVEEIFPYLKISSFSENVAIYAGLIPFSASYPKLETIEDEFEVEITFPLSLDGTPSAREVGDRIPREPEYHINPDGTMCLAAPLEIRRRYKESPQLKTFINDLLIPFLYGVCYKEKHGKFPFGELKHGNEGIIQYYHDLFQSDSYLTTLELLKIIVTDGYRGHMICPCGSNKSLRKCHGPQIMHIQSIQTREQFFSDFFSIFQEHKNLKQEFPRNFVNKKLISFVEKLERSKQT